MKSMPFVAVFGGVVGLACADHPQWGARPQHVRQLVTRYENSLTAPDGPSGYVVARNGATWDSGWRALGLPGSPPKVDFSRELAVLKATEYGSSSMTYSSEIERAELDRGATTLSIYVRLNDVGPSVDTSSRKVVGAAISSASGQAPWQGPVLWHELH